MEDNKWGVGDQAEAKAFDTTLIGKQKVDLIFGQYPHGRSDNAVYTRSEDGEINSFSGHRRLIDIQIRSYNYLKESELSGDDVRNGVEILIFSDGEQVYEAFSREPDRALLQAHSLLGQLQEHSHNWLKREDRNALVGRKIYYREYPAVIERVITDQGCLILKTEDGKAFPSPVYRDRDDVDEYETTVKIEVISPHIWWWRD